MTETTSTATVQSIVAERVGKLQHGYIANRSSSVAALARLRRGAGKEPGSVADIFEHTLAPEFAIGWRDDKPSPAEKAAHIAMTLYALHQQSQSQRMHQPGHGLGRSVRKLISGEVVKPENAVMRRFATLGTADSLDELTHHLRGIVQLLRGGQIPLDYGLLATQLVTWQRFGPTSVRMAWGRDFHFTKQTDSE